MSKLIRDILICLVVLIAVAMILAEIKCGTPDTAPVPFQSTLDEFVYPSMGQD